MASQQLAIAGLPAVLPNPAVKTNLPCSIILFFAGFGSFVGGEPFLLGGSGRGT